MQAVSFDVTCDLRQPVLSVRLGFPVVSGTAVEEATVSEDHQPQRWDHHIRTARHCRDISVNPPLMSQSGPDSHVKALFWHCSRTADARHVGASLLRGVIVSHRILSIVSGSRYAWAIVSDRVESQGLAIVSRASKSEADPRGRRSNDIDPRLASIGARRSARAGAVERKLSVSVARQIGVHSSLKERAGVKRGFGLRFRGRRVFAGHAELAPWRCLSPRRCRVRASGLAGSRTGRSPAAGGGAGGVLDAVPASR